MIKLMPYVLMGYPQFETSLALLKKYCEEGIERIEVGLPFSDPSADGPILQAAHQRAVSHQLSIKCIVEGIAPLKKAYPHVIFTVMTYLNPLIAQGITQSVEGLSSVFTSAVIPDLPLDAYALYAAIFEKHKLAYVPLVTLDTSDERLQRSAEIAKDFIYLVTSTGVTGGSFSDSDKLKKTCEKVRALTRVTIVAGFGIKKPEDLMRLDGVASFGIVATEIISRQALNGDFSRVEGLLQDFKACQLY